MTKTFIVRDRRFGTVGETRLSLAEFEAKVTALEIKGEDVFLREPGAGELRLQFSTHPQDYDLIGYCPEDLQP